MNHPTKQQLRVVSAQMNNLHLAQRWFESLPKAERDEIRDYLNPIPGVKGGAHGICRYWTLTQKETAK